MVFDFGTLYSPESWIAEEEKLTMFFGNKTLEVTFDGPYLEDLKEKGAYDYFKYDGSVDIKEVNLD